MNTNNPMELIGMIRNGANPQQLVLSMLQTQYGDNPFLMNLVQLAQNNQTQEIEQIARNLAKEQGFDFDSEFTNFKKTLGL